MDYHAPGSNDSRGDPTAGSLFSEIVCASAGKNRRRRHYYARSWSEPLEEPDPGQKVIRQRQSTAVRISSSTQLAARSACRLTSSVFLQSNHVSACRPQQPIQPTEDPHSCSSLHLHKRKTTTVVYHPNSLPISRRARREGERLLTLAQGSSELQNPLASDSLLRMLWCSGLLGLRRVESMEAVFPDRRPHHFALEGKVEESCRHRAHLSDFADSNPLPRLNRN